MTMTPPLPPTISIASLGSSTSAVTSSVVVPRVSFGIAAVVVIIFVALATVLASPPAPPTPHRLCQQTEGVWRTARGGCTNTG